MKILMQDILAGDTPFIEGSFFMYLPHRDLKAWNLLVVQYDLKLQLLVCILGHIYNEEELTNRGITLEVINAVDGGSTEFCKY